MSNLIDVTPPRLLSRHARPTNLRKGALRAMHRTVSNGLLSACLVLGGASTLAAEAVPVGGWGVTAYADVLYQDPDDVFNHVLTYSGSNLLQTGRTSRHDFVSYRVGEAEAFVALSAGDALTPVLRTRAQFGSDSGDSFGRKPAVAAATATAREVYQYVGKGPKEFTLIMNLEGEVIGSDSQISALVTANAGRDDFELTGDLGMMSAKLFTSGSATDSLSFLVNTGEFFSVRASLGASAIGANSAGDAYNSLTMSFLEPSGLVAQSRPVPIAGIPWLFAGGWLGLMYWRRRS